MSSLTQFSEYKFYSATSPDTCKKIEIGDEYFDFKQESFLPVKESMVNMISYLPIRTLIESDVLHSPQNFYLLEIDKTKTLYEYYNEFLMAVGRAYVENPKSKIKFKTIN